jgi:hypothetical protein
LIEKFGAFTYKSTVGIEDYGLKVSREKRQSDKKRGLDTMPILRLFITESLDKMLLPCIIQAANPAITKNKKAHNNICINSRFSLLLLYLYKGRSVMQADRQI